MKGVSLILERFDAAAFAASDAASEDDGARERARAEGYAAGFAAGKAAAGADVDVEEPVFIAAAHALRAEIASAPDRIAEQAAGALRIMLESLLPTLAKAGFAIEASEVFARTLREAGDAALEIRTSPNQAAALEGELKLRAPGCAVSVTEDASLKGAQAHASWTSGGVDFDLESAVRDCLSALDRAGETIKSESK